MVMVAGMIFALLLGFVAGRVWEIRQQIIRAEDLSNRRCKAGTSVEAERAGELDLHDRHLMETLDREIRELVMTAALVRRHPTIAVHGLRPMPYCPR